MTRNGSYSGASLPRTYCESQACYRGAHAEVCLLVSIALVFASYLILYYQPRYHLAAHLDPHNSGVLVVSLGGAQRGEKGIGVGDITDRLERDDQHCVIM